MNEEYAGSRATLLTNMRKEMKVYVEHCIHVLYHKEQMRLLHLNFPPNSVIIKCDFIQNILHGRGRETSQSFYNKRQTQLLTFVIWYKKRNEGGEWERRKHFVDYLSSYLKHNSMFFQKCLLHLLDYLGDELGLEFRKVN